MSFSLFFFFFFNILQLLHGSTGMVSVRCTGANKNRSSDNPFHGWSHYNEPLAGMRTHSVGRTEKMRRKGIGSGRKSVHSQISKLIHLLVSHRFQLLLENCSVSMTVENRRLPVNLYQ